MKMKSFLIGLIVGGILVGAIMFFLQKPKTLGRPPMNRGAFTGNRMGTGNWKNNNENTMSGDIQKASESGENTKPQMSGDNNTGVNNQ